MADSKISALPASTTPLAGTEVLPIVQSGTTKQVSVANLTAGRAIAATSLTASGLTSGRVPVVGASGLISDNANLMWDNVNSYLGIGISPNNRLQVAGPSSSILATFRATDITAAARVVIAGNSAGDLISSVTTTGNAVLFSDTGKTLALGTNGSSTGRLTVATGGDVTVNAGNLVIGTDGKGIDFTATPGTGTSELLADYEEGDWTPTIAFGGASVGQSYAIQNGFYTKVGNIVTATGRMAFVAKGSSTGNVTITGLPFTVVNTAAANSAASLRLQAITSTGQVQSSAVLNTTTAAISQITTLGTTSNLADTNFSDSSDVIFTITYRAV